MRLIFRTLRRLIIVILVAIGLFGLAAEFMGLPGGASGALRALPGRLLADARRAVPGDLTTGLPALRTASGPAVDRSGPDSTDDLYASLGCEATAATGAGGANPQTWSRRDADGLATFSDVPAALGGDASAVLRAGRDVFYVTVEAENAVLPGHFEKSLNAAAVEIYDQWRDWLGTDALVRSHIQLSFVGDEDVFMARWGRPDDTDWSPLGFYRIRNNEAVILFTPSQRGAALATAFHEMSHLITARHLGPSPPWLNEGIAEYFETMDLTRAEPRFWLDGQHVGLLRRDGLVPLEELTTLSRRDWASDEADRRYASAWALVTFLLSNEAGRDTLAATIESAYRQRCNREPDVRSALDSYPGGTEVLQRRLERWIQGA